MISTRKRPFILGTMALPALAGPSRISRAQATTPASPVAPAPPAQRATGPGGADYAYDEVIVNDLGEDPPTGVNPFDYWLFEPAGPRPGAPSLETPLPLVLFLVGGMEGINPEVDQGWIHHIVRHGAVVVRPSGWLADGLDKANADISEALAELERGDHVPVDLDRVAVVGQGFGGSLAARMVVAPPEGLPKPAALMIVTPEWEFEGFPEDMALLPSGTRVVQVGAQGAPDGVAALDATWDALTDADQIPASQRAYVVLRSDAHGVPALDASQHVAIAIADYPEYVNALDWYGTWKFLDALMGCAFDGEWCEYAFGDTPEVRYMGTWSDGVPVTEALVIEDAGTSVATPAG